MRKKKVLWVGKENWIWENLGEKINMIKMLCMKFSKKNVFKISQWKHRENSETDEGILNTIAVPMKT